MIWEEVNLWRLKKFIGKKAWCFAHKNTRMHYKKLNIKSALIIWNSTDLVVSK